MTYAVSYREGQEALLYYGAAGSTAATAFGLVQTNQFEFSANEVTGNFRDSLWTNTRPGQRQNSGSFTCRRKTSDATYTALKNACQQGTVVALKMISFSGDATAECVDADYMIKKVSFSEEMDSFQTMTVEYALNIDQRAPTLV